MQHLACVSEVPSVGCWELRLPILLAALLGIQRVTCYSVEIFGPESHLRQRNPSLFSMCLTDQFWKVLLGSGTPQRPWVGEHMQKRTLCQGEGLTPQILD